MMLSRSFYCFIKYSFRQMWPSIVFKDYFRFFRGLERGFTQKTSCESKCLGHPRCNIIYDFIFFILFLFRFRLHHRHCFAIVMSAVSYYTGDEPSVWFADRQAIQTYDLSERRQHFISVPLTIQSCFFWYAKALCESSLRIRMAFHIHKKSRKF